MIFTEILRKPQRLTSLSHKYVQFNALNVRSYVNLKYFITFIKETASELNKLGKCLGILRTAVWIMGFHIKLHIRASD